VIPRPFRWLPKDDFPADEWRIVEVGNHPELLGRVESLFALSNGYLGIRGSCDEPRPAHQRGTFINGFHETWPIMYAEDAYGFARSGQTIINAPDGTIIRLFVDDEPLTLDGDLDIEYAARVLDMRTGLLERELLWRSPLGKLVRVRSQRLVSIEQRHVAAISWEVAVENAEASLVIVSELFNHQDAQPIDDPIEFDPRRAKGMAHRVLDPALQDSAGERVVLGFRAHNSGMTLACGADHAVRTECAYQVTSEVEPDNAKVVYAVDAEPDATFLLTKLLAYHDSVAVPPGELADRVQRTLGRARAAGFDGLAARQRVDLDTMWDRSDVRVDGGGLRLQQAIRWNLFQLMQNTARVEETSIPAKGLSSQAYQGNYFWDVEIFAFPFVLYTQPQIARNLLRFRYSILDKARRRAAEVDQVGALFPWRTINGDEASAYFPAGTGQVHINAAVMHALKRYVESTGDEEFLVDAGAEILLATARFWYDLGFFDDAGRFHIHGVTGPDEYTVIIDDNVYTNLMAQMHLRYAADVVDWLEKTNPERHRDLCDAVRYEGEESSLWRRAADAMYVPYDEQRGINPQDETFLEKQPWDLANTPLDRFPLLLHYHPLVIYRHQVLKQADVVLAMFLRGGEFDPDLKRRNFDYYDPLTTGDSSLSASIQSIVAAEVGLLQKACEYFRYGVYADLADVHGNADDGVHLASVGGVWMNLVYGFGGMRDYDGILVFDPRLPAEWDRLEFSLTTRSHLLRVAVAHGDITFLVENEDGLTVWVRNSEIELKPGEPITVDW
jgi:alpha,alpha-trehalose phosphorylase